MCFITTEVHSCGHRGQDSFLFPCEDSNNCSTIQNQDVGVNHACPTCKYTIFTIAQTQEDHVALLTKHLRTAVWIPMPARVQAELDAEAETIIRLEHWRTREIHDRLAERANLLWSIGDENGLSSIIPQNQLLREREAKLVTLAAVLAERNVAEIHRYLQLKYAAMAAREYADAVQKEYDDMWN